MRWLLKRALLLWLALIGLSVAGVGIGKLDRTPDALQRLGFDVCDGEPCFRGIKYGMNWNEARGHVPEAVSSNGILSIGSVTDPVITVFSSNDQSTVNIITISESGLSSLGHIMAHYGPPCRVAITSGEMFWVYPAIYVDIDVGYFGTNPTANFQTSPDVYIAGFSIAKLDRGCDSPSNPNYGVWYGFASKDTYLARYSAEYRKRH